MLNETYITPGKGPPNIWRACQEWVTTDLRPTVQRIKGYGKQTAVKPKVWNEKKHCVVDDFIQYVSATSLMGLIITGTVDAYIYVQTRNRIFDKWHRTSGVIVRNSWGSNGTLCEELGYRLGWTKSVLRYWVTSDWKCYMHMVSLLREGIFFVLICIIGGVIYTAQKTLK